MMSKKFIGLIVGIVVVVVVVAAVSISTTQSPTQTTTQSPTQTTTQSPAQPKIVNYGMSVALTSIHPGFNTIIPLQETEMLVYDRLLDEDQKTKALIPNLATSWQVSADNLTYTFNLRTGVKFHDGQPFTAAAVKKDIDLIIQNKWSQLQFISVISNVVVVNDYTVQIQLKSPSGAFLYIMTLPSMGIPSPLSLDYGFENYGLHAAGTGPFMVQSFDPNSKLVLVKNENYWGQKAKIDVLNIYFLPDVSSREAALLKGDVDVAEVLNYSNLSQYLANPNLGISVYQETLAMLIPNALKFNATVRQALDYAINKQAIVNNFFGGKISPADMVTTPSTEAFHYGENGLYPYDLAKAKSLLVSAGYSNGLMNQTVNIFYPQGRYLYDKEVLQAIASDWAQIGLTVNLQVVDLSQWEPIRRTGTTVPDFWFVAWATIEPVFDQFANSFYLDNRPTSYNAFWANPAAQNLLYQFEAAADPTVRQTLAKQAQDMIKQDAVDTWLYFQPVVVGFRSDRVKGLGEITGTIVDFRNIERI